MLLATADDLGTRGERLAQILLTRSGTNGRLFRAHFMGDKMPGINLVVELLNSRNGIPLCVVQVKSTRLAHTGRGKKQRLPVVIPERAIKSLQHYGIPRYFVGVDEGTEEGYLLSANADLPPSLRGIPLRHRITDQSLLELWREVDNHWAQHAPVKFRSRFEMEADI